MPNCNTYINIRRRSSRLLRKLLALLILAVVAGAPGCSHSELWNELPEKVSSFIDQYYPSSELESVAHTGNTWHVRIADGAGLTFDADCNWVNVDGYGVALPQVMLFDQLPPRLYAYLQETEQLNGVYAMSRDGTHYTLSLLDSTLNFDTSNGEVEGRN